MILEAYREVFPGANVNPGIDFGLIQAKALQG
jgi:hypothetical protein